MMPILPMIWNTIVHSQNSFAQGGLVLMLVGAVGASLRSIPMALWEWFLRQTTCSIEFSDQDVASIWFKWWFNRQPQAQRVRRTDVYTPWTNDERKAFLIPAPGIHWIWQGLRPFRINFKRTDEKTKGYDAKRPESFTVQTFGRSNAFLRTFMNSVWQAYKQENEVDKTSLYVIRDREWEKVEGYNPRPLSSIIIPPETKNFLINDIKNFQHSEEWYAHKGIPYHRCYLFHGLPGTGKTSIVSGIANELNMNIYIINLHTLDDDQLLRAVADANTNSLFVLEDIDCVKATGARSENGDSEKDKLFERLTLSGLLNALDGIMTPKGSIFIMTTNHKDKLDPALLREGRCDVKLYFGEMETREQIEMYRRYFDDGREREFLSDHRVTTACELQEALLQEHKRRQQATLAATN